MTRLRLSDEATLGGISGGVCRGLLVPAGRMVETWSPGPGIHSLAVLGVLTSRGDIAVSAESVEIGFKSEVFRLRVRPMAESAVALAPVTEWPTDSVKVELYSGPLVIGVWRRVRRAQVEIIPGEVIDADLEEDCAISFRVGAGIHAVVGLDDRIPLNVVASAERKCIGSLIGGLDMRLV